MSAAGDVDLSKGGRGDRVAGKVALVTGAGSSAEGIGNGRAAAIVLARHGAKIGLLDFNEASAAETAEMIAKEGGESVVVQGDVSKLADCEWAVRTVADTFGRLDILVNNVRTSRIRGNALEVDLDAWDRGMQLNVKSMVMMVRFAVPEMRKAGRSSTSPRSPRCTAATPTCSTRCPRRRCCTSRVRWPASTGKTASASTRWRPGSSTRWWCMGHAGVSSMSPHVQTSARRVRWISAPAAAAAGATDRFAAGQLPRWSREERGGRR